MKRAVSGCLAALLIPASAGAAPALTPAKGGAVAIKITQSAQGNLAGKGVRVIATAPAKAAGRELALPVSAGYVGSFALAQAAGSLRLQAKKGGHTRTVELKGLQLKLGSHPVLTALIGPTRLTLLTLSAVKGGVKIDRATRSFGLTTGTPAKLTQTAATTLARVLHVSSMPRRTFAMLRLSAALGAPPATTAGPVPVTAGAAPVTPTTPGMPPGSPAVVPACPLAAGGAAVDPDPGTPPVLVRPSTAVDVVAATLTWNVRDSFIQYINSGEGTSVSGGATQAPATVRPGSSTALHYSFGSPFAHGWCDAASGTAALYGTGAVRFQYSDHGIDLVAASAEVELAGTAARVIFTITSSGAAAARQVVETLDLSHAAAITTSADGRTTTYDRIAAAIPPGAANTVFAGFYDAGEQFGSFSISFTTP